MQFDTQHSSLGMKLLGGLFELKGNIPLVGYAPKSQTTSTLIDSSTYKMLVDCPGAMLTLIGLPSYEMIV